MRLSAVFENGGGTGNTLGMLSREDIWGGGLRAAYLHIYISTMRTVIF